MALAGVDSRISGWWQAGGPTRRRGEVLRIGFRGGDATARTHAPARRWSDIFRWSLTYKSTDTTPGDNSITLYTMLFRGNSIMIMYITAAAQQILM